MSEVTFDGNRWSNAEADGIELAPYDPSWPKRYAEEAAAIRSSLGPDLPVRIEHFGSTAIHGLIAKPIIDILLIPMAEFGWPRLIAPLEALGYVYWADNPRTDRMFFVKGMPPHGRRRSHHVHVRGAEDAEDALLFRDYLNEHPELLGRYDLIKRKLAEEHPTDREAYTSGKASFVEAVLAEARSWRNQSLVDGRS